MDYFSLKELQKEIDNQNASFSNLTQTSEKILDSYKKQQEKDNLQNQLDDINNRWSLLRKKSLEIRYCFVAEFPLLFPNLMHSFYDLLQESLGVE
jgi:hypothetical protein